MAIIGKIREKSWLILLIVGGALLAFILTDYQKMSGNTELIYGYGTIYGEKVSLEDFDEAVNIANINAERSAQQQGQQKQPVDKGAVWNQFIENLLLEREYEALGIDVSSAEFDAYLYGKEGFDVLPDLAQGFTDSITGMFNEKLLQSRIEEMETSDDPEIQKQWTESKEYYTSRRKQEKYIDILNQGMYVTKLEAKNEYFAQKEIKSIAYVLSRYSEIKDDEIDASEAKLKAYFEAHKEEKKYENKETTREVKFFDVTIEASAKDTATFTETMNKLKSDFANTANDSLFVMKNSDFRVYSSTHQATFKPENDEKARQGLTYPVFMDTIFKAASIGDIVGPYDDNGNMRIAKVIDFNENKLSVRHILIAAQRADTLAVEKAKRKTDSLMPLITKDNFNQYVLQYSEDPGSKNTGGKYEDFMDFEMVPEFSKFAVNEAIGKIGYVQTDFGFHIMEVLDRKPVKLPILAIVQKTLKASQNTIDTKEQEIYDLLYKLDEKIGQKENEHAKVVLFDTIVSQAGYLSRSMNIQENSPKLYGFTSKFAEDKILELAFSDESKVGDLVSSPIKDKNRYVIAILSAIKEKGMPQYEHIELAIKRDYIQEQKEIRLKKKMKDVKTLKELTTKMKGTTIQKAEVTFANPQITGAGFEPEVVGALFTGLKDGSKTPPLAGKMGVYVIQIESTTKAPAAANYMVERDQLLSGLKGNAASTAKRALVKLADVVDNRRFFEANIRR